MDPQKQSFPSLDEGGSDSVLALEQENGVCESVWRWCIWQCLSACRARVGGGCSREGEHEEGLEEVCVRGAGGRRPACLCSGGAGGQPGSDLEEQEAALHAGALVE